MEYRYTHFVCLFACLFIYLFNFTCSCIRKTRVRPRPYSYIFICFVFPLLRSNIVKTWSTLQQFSSIQSLAMWVLRDNYHGCGGGLLPLVYSNSCVFKASTPTVASLFPSSLDVITGVASFGGPVQCWCYGCHSWRPR